MNVRLYLTEVCRRSALIAGLMLMTTILSESDQKLGGSLASAFLLSSFDYLSARSPFISLTQAGLTMFWGSSSAVLGEWS